MRTYLIEPQTVFVPYLRGLLADAGLTVVATSNDVDCKDIGVHAPAAVVVDLAFFDRGGATALCRIREAARTATVIALSGSTDPSHAAVCVVAGASTVCAKDDARDVVTALRGALDRPDR